jgi:chitinase
MKRFRLGGLGLVIGIMLAGPIAPPSPAFGNARTGDKVIGYLAPWKLQEPGRGLEDIGTDKLTHLVYAFGQISADGRAEVADPCVDLGICDIGSSSDIPGGNFAKLLAIKRKHPSLRVLISFGGWQGSKYLSDVAATTESRQRFADSVVDVFFRRFPKLFDGVDIDWEYPIEGGLPTNRHRPSDRGNFTLLIAALRQKLMQLSTEYELAIAVSADLEKLKNVEWVQISQMVDWIGVMAYDYHAGSPVANFNAPLFAARNDPAPTSNVNSTVDAFLVAGVPANKIVLGLPFYGRAYANVPPQNNGLFQPGEQAAAGGWGGIDGIDYRELARRQPRQHGFHQHWSSEAQVPWLYSPEQSTWISYDDAVSIEHKARYAHCRNLAGVMIWEVAADDGTLLPAIYRGLGSSRC